MKIDDSRHRLAANLIKYPCRSLLDVGCGRQPQIFQKYLPSGIDYQGIDYFQDTSRLEKIIFYDLEKGIPFPDKSFDVVVGLEILEHLENCHFVFKEMMRVAKNEVIISLPNVFYWIFRLNYLMAKPPMLTYRFPKTPISNRHRWLTTFRQSIDFVEHNAKPFKVDLNYCLYYFGRYHQLLKWFDRLFYKLSPELFVQLTVFHIDKKI